METVIVEVRIPATGQTYDFQLPASGRICDIAHEIARVIEFTQQNVAFDRENPILLNPEEGILLDPGAVLAETSVRDGMRLYLI